MTQVATDPTFPYGTFSVASSERILYEKAPLSRTYPLPDELPMHHPALEQLEGVYPVVDTVPAWWTDRVSHYHPAARPLLQDLTIREWRAGTVDQQRWRT